MSSPTRRWLCRFTSVPSAMRRRHQAHSDWRRRSPASSAPISRSRSSATTAAASGRPTRRPGSSSVRPKALRYVLTAPGELGFARAYVAGEIDVEGDIFDALVAARPPARREGDAARMARAGARRRRRRAAAACRRRPRKAQGPRPPPQQGARRGGDRAPLRRVERLLPARARTVDDVLVRGVRRARHDARSRAGRQVRARLPQARAAARHAPARRRLRVGRDGDARGARTRRARGRRDAVAPGRPSGRATRCARPAWRPRRDPRAGLPRHRTTARSTRSARSACSNTSASRSSTSTSRGCTRLLRPKGRLLNHGIAKRPVDRAPRSRTAGSSIATCSPTASSTRSGPSSPRVQRAGFEVRNVEGSARALRADAAALGGEPRGELGRRRAAGRTGPGAGLAALHGRRRRSTSTPSARRSTRCSRSATTPTERAGCRGAPTGSSSTGSASSSRRGRRTACASPTASCWCSRPMPCEMKRSNSAVAITGAGTPSSIAAVTVQRPSPESLTRPLNSARSGDSCSAAAVRSSNHDATTLPRRHTSATFGMSRSYW